MATQTQTKTAPAKQTPATEKQKTSTNTTPAANATPEEKKETAKENSVLTGSAAVVQKAFKHFYKLMDKSKMEYRGKGKPEEVGAQKRGAKEYEAGTREAQEVATSRWYATITRKIEKLGTDEINEKALGVLKAFVASNPTVEKQEENAQSVLDAVLELYKAERGAGKKSFEKRALTLEDLLVA